MIILCFEALAAIAVSLSVSMAGIWMVQQRTGNSSWVDTLCKLFILLQNQGVGSIPLPPQKGVVT